MGKNLPTYSVQYYTNNDQPRTWCLSRRRSARRPLSNERHNHNPGTPLHYLLPQHNLLQPRQPSKRERYSRCPQLAFEIDQRRRQRRRCIFCNGPLLFPHTLRYGDDFQQHHVRYRRSQRYCEHSWFVHTSNQGLELVFLYQVSNVEHGFDAPAK
jgi:hypothetical protein